MDSTSKQACTSRPRKTYVIYCKLLYKNTETVTTEIQRDGWCWKLSFRRFVCTNIFWLGQKSFSLQLILGKQYSLVYWPLSRVYFGGRDAFQWISCYVSECMHCAPGQKKWPLLWGVVGWGRLLGVSLVVRRGLRSYVELFTIVKFGKGVVIARRLSTLEKWANKYWRNCV